MYTFLTSVLYSHSVVFKSFAIVSAGKEVETFQYSDASNNYRADSKTVYMWPTCFGTFSQVLVCSKCVDIVKK